MEGAHDGHDDAKCCRDDTMAKIERMIPWKVLMMDTTMPNVVVTTKWSSRDNPVDLPRALCMRTSCTCRLLTGPRLPSASSSSDKLQPSSRTRVKPSSAFALSVNIVSIVTSKPAINSRLARAHGCRRRQRCHVNILAGNRLNGQRYWFGHCAPINTDAQLTDARCLRVGAECGTATGVPCSARGSAGLPSIRSAAMSTRRSWLPR
jgi:hypothetical protein